MAYDEDLAARVRDAVAGEPGLTEKRMFGGLAFLVHGNMAVSASSRGGLLLRATRPTRRRRPASRTWSASRCAAGRWTAGSTWAWTRSRPTPDLQRWVDVGLAYARSLPPK